MGKTVSWLGVQVGYSTPTSMHQVVNGHQGVSREVYEKILAIVPSMSKLPPPPIKAEKQGLGAYGKHKKHNYPKRRSET
jgi:hypothetical protein